jgi:CTP:molybdopterin cytidylyltransferase MocA
MRIGLIILAAGGSRRMGEPKQLLPYRGGTLLSHACATALAARGFGPVIAVLGCAAEACQRAIADLPVLTAINPAWAQGLGSSIAVGIGALWREAPDAAAALLMLADQPTVTPALLESLRARWSPPDWPLAATAYPEGAGVPALFDRAFFPELQELTHDRGARALLDREAARTAVVQSPEPLIDLDTPDLYRKHSRP